MTQANRFHYPLNVNPQSGRVRQESDYDEYIRQLILQVLLTDRGERINRPDFGADVRRLLFAPAGPGTATLAQTTVYQALTNWLGTLIRVEAVDVRAENEKLLIRVEYVVQQTGQRRFLNAEQAI